MPLERRDVAAMLEKKGFRKDTGHDHDFFYLYIGETRQAVYTKLSRGTGYRTLGDDLVRKIAHQMKLTKPLLTAFVDCSLDGDGYLQVLRGAGIELREKPSA